MNGLGYRTGTRRRGEWEIAVASVVARVVSVVGRWISFINLSPSASPRVVMRARVKDLL